MATKFHPTQEKRVRAVKVRLTDSELHFLHKAARMRNMNLSAYIRMLIEDDVYTRKKPHFERKTAKKRMKIIARRATMTGDADGKQTADAE